MRKLTTTLKILYLRYDTDKMHVSSKEGRRELASTENCVELLPQGIEYYIKKIKRKDKTEW